MDPLILDLQVDNAQAINSINAFFDIYEKGVDGMAQSLGQALGQPVEVGVELRMENGKVVAAGVEKINKELEKTLDAAKLNNKEFGKTPAEVKRSLTLLKQLRDKTEKYGKENGKVTENWETLSRLIKEATGALDRFNDSAKKNETGKKLEKAADAIRQLNKEAGKGTLETKLISSQIKADALMGAFKGLVGGIRNFVSTGAEMEVLFLQLKGFTGGTEQAAEAYERFVQIGQATPFTAREVGVAARTMMGFGIETSAAIDQVERLAIVASASGGELGFMARNMGQIQANQRAYTRDLMQFANQGIPIYQELAKVMRTSTQHVRELAEEGRVGFYQVSTAIQNMTKEGSVFQQIAAEMDRTFAAKAEAMASAFENFAGQTLAALNKLDQAMGGPIVGAMNAVIGLLNNLGKAAKWVGDNAETVGPILAAMVAGIAAPKLLGVVKGIDLLGKTLSGLRLIQTLLTPATWGLVAAKGALLIVMSKLAVVALAAGIAFGVASVAAKIYAARQAELNKRSEENAKRQDDETAKLAKLKNAVKLLTGARKEELDTKVKSIEADINNREAAKQNAELAMSALKEIHDADMKGLDERLKKRKEVFDEEKKAYQQAKSGIKDYYDNILEREQDALDAMRTRHSEELAAIDAKTPAERALRALEKQELYNKQQTLEIGSKEWLQIQARLDGMARQEKRQAAMLRQKEELKRKEQDIKNIKNSKDDALKHEQDLFRAKEKAYQEDKKNIENIKAKRIEAYEALQAKINEVFADESRLRFENHQDAMRYINTEIRGWQRLQGEIRIALTLADQLSKKKLKEESSSAEQSAGDGGTGSKKSSGIFEPVFGPKWDIVDGKVVNHRASGGPVTGGAKYTVNELGQEAFLSASGRLSKINAPSWGEWRAPGAGTVIPAHLTEGLNIPAGGVNLNQPSGVSRRGAVATAAGGDVFNQTVTVQAANPVQAANNMMVEMTRLRRRRFR